MSSSWYDGSGPDVQETIEFLGPGDWERLRVLRIAAVTDARAAFMVDPTVEAELPREKWEERLKDSTWVAVTRSDMDVAIAQLGGLPLDHVGEDPMEQVRYVQSVWVHPAYRGNGYVRLMVRRLEDVAVGQSIKKLLLWVFVGNDTAWEAYRRLGFRPTGEQQALNTDCGSVVERRMSKDLQQF